MAGGEATHHLSMKEVQGISRGKIICVQKKLRQRQGYVGQEENVYTQLNINEGGRVAVENLRHEVAPGVATQAWFPWLRRRATCVPQLRPCGWAWVRIRGGRALMQAGKTGEVEKRDDLEDNHHARKNSLLVYPP